MSDARFAAFQIAHEIAQGKVKGLVISAHWLASDVVDALFDDGRLVIALSREGQA